ncbi:MAG TPA: tyrosine-type recombinase/integrase [Pirellulales bacterium]|nr:tyrosine-type recombinase/integrase [Pirellulales bacterium]
MPDRNRKALRLGRIAKGDAQKFKFRVERIVTCIKLGESLDAETAAWCAKLPDEEFDKLVAIGLLAQRAKAADFELEAFVAGYIESRKPECAPGTISLLLQAKRSLIEFFGPARQLSQITRADADLFAAHLRQHLGENTAARRIGYVQAFFRRAVRGKLISENPFDDQKATFRPQRDREFFVTQEAFKKVLDACPDAEWRAIWTFARIGGVRIPSELRDMVWGDVDVDAGTVLIRSPKTKHCDKATRILPLFPELRAVLGELYDQAPEGSAYVFPSVRVMPNPQSKMRPIIRAAGLSVWEKLFVNCRASRLTELAEQFPLATVCRWMGNTSRIAAQHYMRDQQADFERATKAAAADLRTECAHSGPVSGRTTEVSSDTSNVPPAKNAGKMPDTVLYRSGEEWPVNQVAIP